MSFWRIFLVFGLILCMLVNSVGTIAAAKDHYINYTVSSDACKSINKINNGVWNNDNNVWYSSNNLVFYKPNTYLKCVAYFYDIGGNQVGDGTIQLTESDDQGKVHNGMLLVPTDTSYILFQMYSGIYNTSTASPFTAYLPGKYNGNQQYYHVNFYDTSLVNGGCPSRLDFHNVTDSECGGLNHYSLDVYGGSITQF